MLKNTLPETRREFPKECQHCNGKKQVYGGCPDENIEIIDEVTIRERFVPCPACQFEQVEVEMSYGEMDAIFSLDASDIEDYFELPCGQMGVWFLYLINQLYERPIRVMLPKEAADIVYAQREAYRDASYDYHWGHL